MNDYKQDTDPMQSSEEDVKHIVNVLRRMSHPAPDIDAEWNKISKRIDQTQRLHRLLQSTLYAAAIILLIIIVALPKASDHTNEVFTANNANEELTITSDHKNTRIVKGTSLSFAVNHTSQPTGSSVVAVAVPRGKDCNIILPDGTKVWLNAESKLEFPKMFSKTHRMVRLCGEAYFEVSHNKKCPFIVKTDKFVTTVTGTSFNICAYATTAQPEVVVVDGSVKVTNDRTAYSLSLHPGQMACLNGQGTFHLSTVDTYPYTQRKEGFLYFDNKTLLDIMVELGRWYNKTVIFENEEAMYLRLHFVADRGETLRQILENLNEMDGVKIVIKDNEIIVK